MLPAPIPPDEASRLQALQALLVLDTPPEERFDRIVRFAAQELDAPIALVSLIDEHRQWFKSRFGLDAVETARDISFCGHAIVQPELFIVGDAAQDERFADNPLVTGPPYIRFYAGVPVCAPSGERVGTLCVIDTRPRELGRIERAVMKALSQLVNEALAGEGDA
jgi:GAF domain-containing protein